MKIRKIVPYFLLFLCLVAVNWPSTQAAKSQSTPAPVTFRQSDLTIQSSGGEHHFTIEVADTPEQKTLGLMFRKTLARDHGMLFVGTQDETVRMWMKNTLIPLDMIFIDSQGRIVYIAANTTPESTSIITAGQPVRAVLELAGGTAALFGINVGDRVIYSAFRP